MSMMVWPIGPASSKARMDLLTAIQLCGQTANLRLCLDAGDDASWPGSGQKWLDVAGGGYDFFRGADNTATTDDPTFNGSAGGRSSSEYFSGDGGDYFTYDTTIEGWMSGITTNTLLSWLMTIRVPSDTDTYGFNTSGSGQDGIGARYVAANDRIGTAATNGNPSTPTTSVSLGAGPALAPPGVYVSQMAMVIGGAAVSGAYNLMIDDVSGVSAAGTYPNNVGSPTSPPTIGRASGTNAPSGTRWYNHAVWTGRRLSVEEQAALFFTIRGKFGK